MAEWHNFTDLYPGAEHTITGTVMVCQNVYSKPTDDSRDVLVYLPPSYANTARWYPVLYMHDGQNLFDEPTSYSGEWRVDETIEALSGEGIEAIVVGIPNVEAAKPGARLVQYAPFPNGEIGLPAKGDDYLAFVCDTVKSLIDANFRTLPDRAQTGIMGSSMGALISLYAYFQRPAVFGFVGMMSPAFWFTDDDAIFDYVTAQPHRAGKLYLDVGTAEMENIPPDDRHAGVDSGVYLADARRMNELLLSQGYQPGAELRYVEEEGAVHHESAWARRLPDALRFWLSG